ncbi:hypothetical protein ACEWY4_023493 [Coilia grayii]|uniref:Ig-like domain-containing protein n=1 Tax=Coilia grayii TaxID=363190 RepID=A0ABD1J528_9TELE
MLAYDKGYCMHFRLDQKALAQRWVLLLICCTISQGVKIIGDNKEVYAGEDVVLACKLVETTDEVLRVDWMRTTPQASKQNIFTIIRSRDPVSEDVNGLKDRLKFAGSIEERIGNIQLLNAQVKDNGNYSCSFVLYEGGSVSKSIHLIVKASPEINVPSVTPLVGMAEVTLATCSADNAYPPASVLWDASSLGNNVTAVTNSKENPDGTISVTSNLMGIPSRDINKKEVQCLVKQLALNGQYIFGYSINIQYPPVSAKVIPLESRAPSLTFQCKADANPEPEHYTWKRDGRPLDSKGVGANGSILIFQTLTPDINGLYDCEVSNVYGSAEGSLHLYSYGNTRHNYVSWIVVILLGLTSASMYLCYRIKRNSSGQYASTAHSGSVAQPQQRTSCLVLLTSATTMALHFSLEHFDQKRGVSLESFLDFADYLVVFQPADCNPCSYLGASCSHQWVSGFPQLQHHLRLLLLVLKQCQLGLGDNPTVP